MRVRAIRFVCSAEPLAIFNCHCRDCQKASGASFISAIAVPSATVTITGQPKYHSVPTHSGNTMSRGFCAECGSRLFARISGRADYDWNPSDESRRSQPLSPDHGHLDFECTQVGPHEPVAAEDSQGAAAALSDIDAKRTANCPQPKPSGDLCRSLPKPEVGVRPRVRRSSIRRKRSISLGRRRSRCVGDHSAEP
jgi:hypothetical protein